MRRHGRIAARNAAGRREMQRLYKVLRPLTALNVSPSHNAPSVSQGISWSIHITACPSLASMSYATDNVFGDGTSLQMASVSGDPVNGYVVTLTIGMSL
jgi:hypothetical protein